jgi:hypothetical protein
VRGQHSSDADGAVVRRQWWATFSVRAHRSLHALASDVLLYDRLILPKPSDAAEEARFEESGWEPDLLELVEIQAADSIYTLHWSEPMRDEWKRQCRALNGVTEDLAMGMTPLVMAQTPQGWNEIMAAFAPDANPDSRPIIFPAFQSAAEARARLRLRPVGRAGTTGRRAPDRALALEFERIVEEPALRDPEEAFLAASQLASKEDFRRARAALLDFVDKLRINDSPQATIEKHLGALVEDYNSAVRDFRSKTRKRRAFTVVAALGGAGVGAATGGIHAPILAKAASAGTSWTLRQVTGRFAPEPSSPDDHPGRALAMTHAAFRDLQPRKL